MYMKLGFIILLAILSLSSSLKVYSRSIPSTDLSKKVCLQYKNSKLNEGIYWKKGLTVCIRFKYEQLGTTMTENVLFSIGQSNSTLVSFITRGGMLIMTFQTLQILEQLSLENMMNTTFIILGLEKILVMPDMYQWDIGIIFVFQLMLKRKFYN